MIPKAQGRCEMMQTWGKSYCVLRSPLPPQYCEVVKVLSKLREIEEIQFQPQCLWYQIKVLLCIYGLIYVCIWIDNRVWIDYMHSHLWPFFQFLKKIFFPAGCFPALLSRCAQCGYQPVWTPALFLLNKIHIEYQQTTSNMDSILLLNSKSSSFNCSFHKNKMDAHEF